MAKNKKRRGFWGYVWLLIKLATLFALIGAITGAGIGWHYYKKWVMYPQPGHELPDVGLIGTEEPMLTSKVYDRSGKELIGEIATEKRTVLPLAEIPPVMQHALLAAEDAEFYSHGGVSPTAILKALLQKLRHPGQRMRGASTITQQVVKPYVGTARSVERKVREMELAVRLTEVKSKDEILAIYLNRNPMGNRRFGVEEASQYYFGKSVRNITLAEAALLASLYKAPETYPKHLDAWKARQRYVLAQMYQHDWASLEEAQAASAEPIKLIEHPPIGGLAPEYVVEAEHELAQMNGKDLSRLGYTIHTTCDLPLQQAARAALNEHLDYIDEKNGDKPRPQGAVLVIDNATREAIAMVGGSKAERGNFNRILQSRRQPGSTFKAFVWATALFVDREEPFTLSTTLVDEERTYPITGSKPWTPKNHSPSTNLPVTLRAAFEHSLNTISAQLTDAVWPDAVVSMAKRVGIKTELRRTYAQGEPVASLSLALGTSEVTPLELANAYTTLATGGKYADPAPFILEMIGKDGKRAVHEKVEATEVIPPALAYLMTTLMQGVIKEGTGVRAKNVKFPQAVGGKTGTTQNATDAWFVGYSPDVTVVVWVGNDKNETLGSYWEGSRAALPIWIKVMQAALKGRPRKDFGPPPPGVVELNGEFYLEGKTPPPATDAGTDGGETDGDTSHPADTTTVPLPTDEVETRPAEDPTAAPTGDPSHP